MYRYEIRLSGAGGQGMITAGIILAEAALHENNINVTQTQSYGPESRGGASRAEVVLSPDIIDYPKVTKPNILVALTQKAFEKYNYDIKEDGIIIVDEGINTEGFDTKARIYSLPILKTAEDKVGKKLTANMVVLGIINKFIKEIRSDSVEKGISSKFPKKLVDMNIKAFEIGEQLSKNLK